MAETERASPEAGGEEYDKTEADHDLDLKTAGNGQSFTGTGKNNEGRETVGESDIKEENCESQQDETPPEGSSPLLVNGEKTESGNISGNNSVPAGSETKEEASVYTDSDTVQNTSTNELSYAEKPEDEQVEKPETEEGDCYNNIPMEEKAHLDQNSLTDGQPGLQEAQGEVVDNVDGEDSESKETEEVMEESLNAESSLPVATVPQDDSPTLSLAEEDQLEVQVNSGIDKEEDRNGAVSQHVDTELTSEPSDCDTAEETEKVDPKLPVSKGDISEPDDPECDLVSKGLSTRSPEEQVSQSVAKTKVASVAAPPSSISRTSSFLGHLKQGIKAATKDNSPIREALGNFQQNLRTAISETSTFLEGPQVSAARAHSDSPIPLHATSSEPAMHTTSVHSQNSHEPRSESTDLSQKTMENPSPSHAPNPEQLGDGAGDGVTVSDVPEDELLTELDAELETERAPPPRPPPPNGVRRNLALSEIPEYKELKVTCEQLRRDLQQQKEQATRLVSVNEAQDSALLRAQQEAESYRKQLRDSKSKTSEDIFIAQVKALENTIASQQKEINAGQEKLVAHDKAAKEAVAKLQAEMKLKVDQLTSKYEGARKEKEDMVLKYAKAESKNIEMESRMAKNDAKMKDMTKERENVLAKSKTLKADQLKCRELFESRSNEVIQLRRELEKLKEQFVSQEGKTKWAHNKLRQEIDAHKETRFKLDECWRKNKVLRDEAEQIRRDCQSMVKCYQESEEIKSNSLDQELKNKETELLQHKQEKLDQQEVHSLLRRELDTLKMKHKEMLEELKTWRDKVKLLDAERIIQEQNLDKYRETLQKQKETNMELERRLADLEDIDEVVSEVKQKNLDLELRNEEVEQECLELRIDMERCSTREQDHLEFTQKISNKNAHLQSENTALLNKVKGLTAENERLTGVYEELEQKKESLETELSTEKKQRTQQCEDLTKQLDDKTKEVERLTVGVDDAQNEIKTLKRKHAGNTKDLTRQLQAAKRRLEAMDSKDGVSSMGSRTSSNGSLDTVNGQPRSASTSSQPPAEPEPFVEIVEVDKQMLIEKIVRLQKAHARKNEKLEFMEDHIQQLFTEVQKKTKIIQNYALREEAGTISPDSVDTNKALLAKKGGIMASLYTSHQQDGAMTLDLSLDINRKLQAVLEDTLLKNITLKENLDTLGEEIARLSQENRAIKLSGHEET